MATYTYDKDGMPVVSEITPEEKTQILTALKEATPNKILSEASSAADTAKTAAVKALNDAKATDKVAALEAVKTAYVNSGTAAVSVTLGANDAQTTGTVNGDLFLASAKVTALDGQKAALMAADQSHTLDEAIAAANNAANTAGEAALTAVKSAHSNNGATVVSAALGAEDAQIAGTVYGDLFLAKAEKVKFEGYQSALSTATQTDTLEEAIAAEFATQKQTAEQAALKAAVLGELVAEHGEMTVTAYLDGLANEPEVITEVPEVVIPEVPEVVIPEVPEVATETDTSVSLTDATVISSVGRHVKDADFTAVAFKATVGEAGLDLTAKGTATVKSDLVYGTAEEFNNGVITGFGEEDALGYQGVVFNRENLNVKAGSAILELDSDGNGKVDSTLKLEGDFTGGDFMAVSGSNGTMVTYEKFMPKLVSGQKLDESLVNGINNQDFLTGNGTEGYKVALKDMGFAGYNNVVGVYEIDAQGDIVDTKILFKNANDHKSADAIINNVEAGHTLGFFVVQDAADSLASYDKDAFHFVNHAGQAANTSDGANIMLAVENGVFEDVTVFHSYSAKLNADANEHVVSGVEVGGRSMLIGFEDMTGDKNNGNEYDYEDVVFEVMAIDTL